MAHRLFRGPIRNKGHFEFQQHAIAAFPPAAPAGAAGPSPAKTRRIARSGRVANFRSRHLAGCLQSPMRPRSVHGLSGPYRVKILDWRSGCLPESGPHHHENTRTNVDSGHSRHLRREHGKAIFPHADRQAMSTWKQVLIFNAVMLAIGAGGLARVAVMPRAEMRRLVLDWRPVFRFFNPSLVERVEREEAAFRTRQDSRP